MLLQELIKSLAVTDEQYKKIVANNVNFQPQLNFTLTIIISKSLKYLYVSEMGARYLKVQSSDILGKNWRDLIFLPSDDFERLDKKIAAVFHTGTFIYDNYVSDSTITRQQHYFEYLISPIFTSSGDIEAVMCNITVGNLSEISASDQADLIGKQYRLINEYLGIEHNESAIIKELSSVETNQEILSASERKYSISKQTNFKENKQESQQLLLSQYLAENKKLNQLIELCPLGIVLYDNKGNIIILNKAHRERISVFKREEYLGKPGRLLVEALGLDWEDSPCNQALKGIETSDYYLKNVSGDCSLLNAIPLRNYENTIIGAMTISYDITKYENFKKEMSKLDRLNLIGEMATGVAHEIRNPMTVIKGYLQFFSKNASDSMVEQFRIVLGELERIEQIITDFLSLARNKRIENKEQNLNSIIEEMIPLIATNAMEQDIELKVNLAEGLPHLLLNEKEIKQLLLNLARNGIEAMDHHGTLCIESIIEGDMVSLSVADCGCGICKENQEKIFDPFFTTKESGTGLGLSVCAGIVRRHNGTIEVESEEGKGTRFIITFNALDAR